MADSDAELMAQIAEGDRRAFGLLVDRYKHPIVGYLTRITGDPDRAGDLAQETFVRLFQSACANWPARRSSRRPDPTRPGCKAA